MSPDPTKAKSFSKLPLDEADESSLQQTNKQTAGTGRQRDKCDYYGPQLEDLAFKIILLHTFTSIHMELGYMNLLRLKEQ